MGLDYEAAGVNKEAGYEQVQLIKDQLKKTYSHNVLTEVGGFSGLFQLNQKEMEEPVLVSGTDGVGTKLMIAQDMDCHHSIGIDLVAMCVNDILCQGAQPLFFLDYIATGKLIPEKMAQIVEGVAEGCLQSGAALIGGETAEMPGMYGEDDYDLAGFAVGVVDKSKIISGSTIADGDIAIGLPSSGVHSNGFSLVRAILEKNNIQFKDQIEGLNTSVGESLLTPTTIYAKEIQALIQAVKVKGIAHITGGGLYENLPRVLGDGKGIKIDPADIPSQDIFRVLQDLGQVEDREMYNTFNMGVGMVVFVSPTDQEAALASLRSSCQPFILGQVDENIEGVHMPWDA